MDKVKFCGHSHYLSKLNTEWNKVLHLGIKKTFLKGATIQYNEAETFGYLASGQIRLSAISIEGKERIAFYLEDGCICMENEIFNHAYDMTITEFVATKNSVIYFFSKKYLTDLQFASENPELMLSIIRSMALKTGAFFSQLSEKAVLNSSSQLCRFICREYDKYNTKTFNFGYSQIELASMLSIHRNTLCRHLRELRESGIIGKCTKNCIEILDIEKLRELAQI